MEVVQMYVHMVQHHFARFLSNSDVAKIRPKFQRPCQELHLIKDEIPKNVRVVELLPSGELTFCHGKWPFIVDFPIKHGDFPWQNVSSPEGNWGRSQDIPVTWLPQSSLPKLAGSVASRSPDEAGRYDISTQKSRSNKRNQHNLEICSFQLTPS